MRVAVLGRTKTLLKSAEAVSNKHEIVLVGTNPSAPEYGAGPEDYQLFAERVGCPYFCAGSFRDSAIQEMVSSSTAEVAISMNWQTLIPKAMLDIFPLGIINAHCGDLPRYRGNAIPNWSILQGEPNLCLTLHRMTPELDSGPVFLQRRMSISDQTYVEDVYRFLSDQLPSMFQHVIDAFARGDDNPINQQADLPRSLRCYPRLPRDGFIEWAKPAAEIALLVRASSHPFEGAFSYYQDRAQASIHKVTIWRAATTRYPGGDFLAVPGHVIHLPDGQSAVACGDSTLLLLEEIDVDGLPQQPSQVFKGARHRLGLDVTSVMSQLQAGIRLLEE